MRSISVARRYAFRCSAVDAELQRGDDELAAAASAAASQEPGGLLTASPSPATTVAVTPTAAPVSLSVVWFGGFKGWVRAWTLETAAPHICAHIG